jgi:hypothetical protein
LQAVSHNRLDDAFGLPATHGISDIDLVYFDGDDLSQGAEASHAAGFVRCSPISACGSTSRTGARAPLVCREVRQHPRALCLDRGRHNDPFRATATSVGVQPRANGLRVFSPYGLSDLLGLIVRPNKKQITRPIYDAKVEKWLARWPELRVVPWDG